MLKIMLKKWIFLAKFCPDLDLDLMEGGSRSLSQHFALFFTKMNEVND